MFFSPSAVESYLSNNKIKKKFAFALAVQRPSALEAKKIKKL
jgi:uroporphyrinogen-III synthase